MLARPKRTSFDTQNRRLWKHGPEENIYEDQFRQAAADCRVDHEILDWLKSEGHLSRINQILRDRLTQERQ